MPCPEAFSSMPSLDKGIVSKEHRGMEKDGWINLLGLCAGFLTTVSFLPQLIKAWKSRSTHDISIGMFSLLAVGIMLWIAYGLFTDDLPVIAANTVTLVFVGLILVLKLRYR
jgi:MtN3 and saliva related transmembrane protein